MNTMMCRAGEFVSEALACMACPDFTYNSVPGRNERCEPCTRCFLHSYIEQRCNKTHDNVCSCDKGYIHPLSRPKFCVKDKFVLEAVQNVTESNFSTMEQAVDNATINIPTTTDHHCLWTPWLTGWSCISPLAAFAISLMFVGIFIYICYRIRLRDKRQHPDAAVMADPEKNTMEQQQQQQQQQGIQEEKQGLLCEQENQNSIVYDARSSLSQFNSGGSDQVGISESSLDEDCPASVRYPAYDHTCCIVAVPPSSLCQEQEYHCSSLNLREDEDLTPIKEVAEAAGYQHYNT